MIYEQLLLITLFIGILLFLYLFGVPIAFAMILTSVLFMASPYGPGLNVDLVAIQLLNGPNSFVLVAVPLYILLGRLLNEFELTERLFAFATSLVGQFRGGLAYVNILASMLFAGMSGLALADVAGLGRIEYRAMKDAGYTDSMTIGVTGSSSVVGPIIPPSVTLIIYGVLAGVSIGSLFLAGIIPGILLGLSLMGFVFIQARKQEGLQSNIEFSPREVWTTFKGAFLSLLIPVIIVVGILTGQFTATEAGAVAVAVAMVLGAYYGHISWSGMTRLLKKSAVETFSILLIIAAASLYSFVAVQLRLPTTFIDAVSSITADPTLAVLLIAVLLLIIGTFMEPIAALTILVPVVLPVIESLRVNPISFGVVMVFALTLGTITPPFGIILFVLERVTGNSVEEVMRAVAPYYIPLLLVLVLMILFPSTLLILPNMAG
jgi:tripartite ATP-independent transporter DctM subunit